PTREAPATPRQQLLLQSVLLTWRTGSSALDCIRGVVGGVPTPRARPVAAARDPFAIDVGDHLAVTGEERARRAHFSAQRQLAFRNPVAAVLLHLGIGTALLRSASAEGALVHFSTTAEVCCLRVDRKSTRLNSS